MPICGSSYGSVLQIVPGSHLWSDEDVVPTHKYDDNTKRIGENGVAYSTPTIEYCKQTIISHRPDVPEGGYMLFSPIMIHGAGSNKTNKTRFSLEIRFEIIEDNKEINNEKKNRQLHYLQKFWIEL